MQLKNNIYDEIIICDHNSYIIYWQISKSYTDKIIVLDKSIGRDRSVITSSKNELLNTCFQQIDELLEK